MQKHKCMKFLGFLFLDLYRSQIHAGLKMIKSEQWG